MDISKCKLLQDGKGECQDALAALSAAGVGQGRWLDESIGQYVWLEIEKLGSHDFAVNYVSMGPFAFSYENAALRAMEDMVWAITSPTQNGG